MDITCPLEQRQQAWSSLKHPLCLPAAGPCLQCTALQLPFTYNFGFCNPIVPLVPPEPASVAQAPRFGVITVDRNCPNPGALCDSSSATNP